MTRVARLAADPNPVRRFQLTPARRRLLDLFDELWFGRIEDLLVANGEPQFDRPPRAVITLKIAGRNDPRPAKAPLPDEPVSWERLELFAQLEQLGSGLVRRIEVAHANPLFLEIAADPPPAA